MKSDQDLYKRLRDLPKERLWTSEVARFDAASPRERLESVAIIRAVGMIFSRFGTAAEKATVRGWLMTLLKDPQEKIRRYAMTALPKIGTGMGDAGAEKELLSLLMNAEESREMRHLGRALEKVGGAATLEHLSGGEALPGLTEQKVRASLLRQEKADVVRLDALLPLNPGAKLRSGVGMTIHLRCRRGLERIVTGEAEDRLDPVTFRVGEVRPGCVTLTPLRPFTLEMIYRLRCFATIGFRLGVIANSAGAEWEETLALCIASPLARSITEAATGANTRYRLDFPERGHQRGAIRKVVDRAYALAPSLLNDARQATWSVDVIPAGRQAIVELRPRLYPDPRLGYRRDDVAAASHPPLAACMARLALLHQEPSMTDQAIWDPFCGSSLELIERAMLGGVSSILGTDLDAGAIEVARVNVTAAMLEGVRSEFHCSDFRNAEIAPESLALIITNPPLGRRVRVKDMQGFMADLLRAAVVTLRPGGLLLFTNPLKNGPSSPSLLQEYRQAVDLGGFDCWLDIYRKV